MKLTNYEWWRAGRLGTLCWIVVGLAGMTLALMMQAQGVSTTTVQGTVYLANGQAGAGTLVVSWPAFTTAAGQAIVADSLTYTIPADGFVSVNLAPNVGALPAGEYYTATFYMSDGTVNTQYWQVPAAASASLAQIEVQVMPAAQAVQAVTKAYVDEAISEISGSGLTATGGTLTAPLYLNADPTQPLQAATKHYVDTQVATDVPLAGGNMTGALGTPAVNGVEAPAAGSAQTTLQTAMTAAGTNGAMQIPPTYAGTDTFTNPNGVKVTDLRTGVAQQAERSVKEFGAVCDGATDDTNALQAALNYANAHNVALTIPEGTCKTRTLNWHGESIGGLGKQVSALMGFPGQDVLATTADSPSLMQYTRLHDLTIYVDQSVDVSCTAAKGRATAGSCQVSRPMEANSIFSAGGNGLTNTAGTGAAWAVGNCAIAMPAATGAGGNGMRVAEIENLEIATTGTDPMASQYTGAHSTHTCGLYLAQWPQWSEFRNIDIRGLNTGVAIPALPVTTPAGLTADSNRWQNVTIQATHAFTAAAGSNNVLDNVVASMGNSSATGEPPTGLVLDFAGTQQGWTARNAVVLPTWNAVQPALTVTVTGGAVTAVTIGTEHGLGWDPYGITVPLAFSGSCTATGTATVSSNGSISAVSITAGGAGCSSSTTARLNAAGTWDTDAPVNLIGGQDMTFFAGNLLNGNGGYTVWNAASSASYGTQLDGGGGNLPGGGSYPALVANSQLGSTLLVDQFPGANFGAKLQACLSAVNTSYGGTCDARNFTGSLSMTSNLTISTGNTTVLLPCATISTAYQIVVTAGTRNAMLRGCALRGGSAASGSQGGTAFAFSGTGAMVQVGDPTYATDTLGFHLDNVVVNTTAATSASAKGVIAYRTQELDLESLYLLGNGNQTAITLDGTGNYTGGTFLDNEIDGFQTAVNAIGHQVANPATTDWMNASTFVRLHIDCPTSGGSPVSGTIGINLQQGDGNTFTGGDVEGCATALHLGLNAQNNTIVGLRNENSTNQVVADAGSSYNDWMTGGTMFTGQLTDNGTRNSFLDSFHRSFNGMNGDWYGSQQDATVTNHFRLGTGAGNERGLENRYQTDFGYRWTMGLSDATSGQQTYQILDELNGVNRLSIGQYLSATANTITNVILNNNGCYITSTPPTIGFTGGGGTGAAATATMYAIATGTTCVGGYGVASVTMTNNGTGYSSHPTVTWIGSNQTTAPNAVAEITTAGSTNNQTVINAAGTGAIVLNGSNNAGTGGVVIGSGGASESTVATISNAGNAQFNGTLQVGGASQSTGTMTVRNNADAEVDYYLWPGVTTSQKGSFTYKDWNGNSQWYLVKDASNNWEVNSAIGGLDSFKAYQSTNSGDTYVDASNSAGHIRLNYETGSGAETDIYSGSSTSLDAAFLSPTSIKLPGMAAGSGYNCLQVDTSGYITNTGLACGAGSGSGTVGSGSAGAIAYYTASGTTVAGESTVPVASGGTGAASAPAALANLGGVSAAGGTMTGALTAPQFNGPLSGNASTATALAATPAQCSGNNFSTGVSAGGAANCAQVTYTQIGGTTPTWNQSTTGAAANITATSNSTLTTLPALALPYSQLSGTVPTWNQNTTGTAGNVTGTVAVANGGTGAATAAGAISNLLPGVSTYSSNGVGVAGSAQVNGTLQVGSTSTFTGSTTVMNQANAEIDSVLQAGSSASQKESFLYKDYNGTNEWYMVKDSSDNWSLNSAVGGLDSFKAYQSTNSGDTYVDASNSTGHIRLNYETGAGAETDIYSGSSTSLDAAFLSPTSIKFPGLAAGSGYYCLQVDTSGYMTSTGSPCGTGSGGATGIVNSATTGQIAYYTTNGTTIGGQSTVPITAGGTGAATAAAAVANLLPGVASDGSSGVVVTGNVAAASESAKTLGGFKYASQYQTGSGNNGIANASSGTTGQTIIADPSYGTTERPSTTSLSANAFHYQDRRNGSNVDYFHNSPLNIWSWPYYGWAATAGQTTSCLFDGLPGAANAGTGCQNIMYASTTPGWSLGNPGIAGGGSGWFTGADMTISDHSNSAGIFQGLTFTHQKFGIGDSTDFYAYIFNTHNGWTAPSDEGTKPIAGEVSEDQATYTGTISSGASTGSTSLKTTAVTDSGSQGVGQYLIDTSNTPVTGAFTGIGAGVVGNSAVTVSTTVPVSNAWGTLAANVTAPVNTSSPFSTSETFNVNITSGAFDTVHLACFAINFHDCAVPTAVGAVSGGVQSVTMPTRRPHASGGYLFQGGMAGYGFEQTALTVTPNGQPLRYLLDVVGSTSANTLQVIQWLPNGVQAAPLNSSFFQTINMASGVTNGGSGTTVSFTNAGGGTLYQPYTHNLATITFSGLSDSALNTACTGVVWTSTIAGTCAIAGLSGSHTSTTTGTASLALNQFKVWPMAEILDVQNETLSPPQVDGTFALEPNIIPFAGGDTVENPHHASALTQGQTLFLTHFDPYAYASGLTIGWNGTGAQGGGSSTSYNAVISGANQNNDSIYIENGGIENPPNVFNFSGAYTEGFLFNHGPASGQSLLWVFPTATQIADANYCFNVWTVYGYSNFQSCPHAGGSGGSASLTTTGTQSYTASSHIFNGVVNGVNGFQVNGNTVLPTTLTGYHGNSSGVKVPLAVNWTNSTGAMLCDDGNGNITVSGCIGTTLLTNGVNNASQAALNHITSTVNAAGLTVTPSNPSTSSEKFEVTGTVIPAAGGTGQNTASSTGVAQVSGGTWSVSTALANGTTATTQTAGDNTVKVATDAFVNASITAGGFETTSAAALLAPLASPALTGSPTAPTQIAGDNSTKVATDAFVAAAVAAGGVTLQTNGVNNALQTALNHITSTVNAAGLIITPSNPSTSAEKFEATGTLIPAAGGTGQNTASSTGVAQVSGGTWSVSTALTNGTTAATQTAGDNSTKVATDAFVAAAVAAGGGGGGGGGTTVTVNGGSSLSSLNINAASPSADSNYVALTPKVSGSNAILEAPYASSSAPGVVQCGTGTTCASGVISTPTATYWTSPFYGSSATPLSTGGSANRIGGYGFTPEVNISFSTINMVIYTADTSNLYSTAIANTSGTLLCSPATGVNLPASNTQISFSCSQGTVTLTAGTTYILLTTGSSTTGSMHGIANDTVTGSYYSPTVTGCTSASGAITGTCSITLSQGLYAAFPGFSLH